VFDCAYSCLSFTLLYPYSISGALVIHSFSFIYKATNCWVCALQWASLYPSRKYPGSQPCDSGGVTTGCLS